MGTANASHVASCKIIPVLKTKRRPKRGPQVRTLAAAGVLFVNEAFGELRGVDDGLS